MPQGHADLTPILPVEDRSLVPRDPQRVPRDLAAVDDPLARRPPVPRPNLGLARLAARAVRVVEAREHILDPDERATRGDREGGHEAARLDLTAAALGMWSELRDPLEPPGHEIDHPKLVGLVAD